MPQREVRLQPADVNPDAVLAASCRFAHCVKLAVSYEIALNSPLASSAVRAAEGLLARAVASTIDWSLWRSSASALTADSQSSMISLRSVPLGFVVRAGAGRRCDGAYVASAERVIAFLIALARRDPIPSTSASSSCVARAKRSMLPNLARTVAAMLLDIPGTSVNMVTGIGVPPVDVSRGPASGGSSQQSSAHPAIIEIVPALLRDCMTPTPFRTAIRRQASMADDQAAWSILGPWVSTTRIGLGPDQVVGRSPAAASSLVVRRSSSLPSTT